jgi:hypothetical protein
MRLEKNCIIMSFIIGRPTLYQILLYQIQEQAEHVVRIGERGLHSEFLWEILKEKATSEQ